MRLPGFWWVHFLYNAVWLLVWPFFWTVGRTAGLRRTAAGQRRLERLGIFRSGGPRQWAGLPVCGGRGVSGPLPGSAGAILVHAVSAGEVAAVVPLIGELRVRFPGSPVVLSTVTEAGQRIAGQRLGDGIPVLAAPFDAPWVVARWLDRLRPRLVVVAELEIWPNLFLKTAARGIPLVMASARMPDREWRGYRLFSGYFRAVLGPATVAAQGGQDARRYRQLGASRVESCGNLKYALVEGTQVALLPAAPVVVVGSTHPVEEMVIISALIRLRESFPGLVCVVAPRRASRGPALKNRLIRAGFPARLRSQGGGERDQCLVLDTIGELAGWYDKAVVAVVGGSFSRRINGHNPLEPAALGRPVVFGPWMAHFREESGALLASGGAVRVADATGLADALGFWLGDRKAARKAGGAARAVVVAGQGAVSRTMDLIEKACTGPLNL